MFEKYQEEISVLETRIKILKQKIDKEYTKKIDKMLSMLEEEDNVFLLCDDETKEYIEEKLKNSFKLSTNYIPVVFIEHYWGETKRNLQKRYVYDSYEDSYLFEHYLKDKKYKNPEFSFQKITDKDVSYVFEYLKTNKFFKMEVYKDLYYGKYGNDLSYNSIYKGTLECLTLGNFRDHDGVKIFF